LLCDVSFSDPSENDTELQEQFDRLSNYIVSYSPGENIEDSNIVFNAEKAVSGYETFNIDKFIKFKLVQNDSLKSMPLRMYEELHNTRLRKGNSFYRIGKEFILNSFIVDFEIWPFDVSNNNGANYDLINLGDFDFIPDSAFKKLTNNRIIILGDYELNDIHETLYGPMSGPLILLNTFLALEDGDNVISPFFVIYLFICFFLISGFSLDFETKERRKLYIFKFKNTFIDEALEFLTYVFFLSLISSISFFLFNIHLTILLFASYLYFLDFINKYLVNRQLKSPKSENVFYSFDDGVDA
ncbi:MAG: hypothetical protein P1P88_24800, partial [Bacteroidales bacterium]|nr:hypothetical protein [Bacteroidales bacterium]